MAQTCRAVLSASSAFFQPTKAPLAIASAAFSTSPRRAASYRSWLNFSSLAFSSPSSSLYSINPFHWYLDLIQFSLVARESSAVGRFQPLWWASPASHILLAFSFPIESKSLPSGSLRSSSRTDLILLTWTPRLRWTPLQSMHTTTPRFRLTQSGSLAPQSAQKGLASNIFLTAGFFGLGLGGSLSALLCLLILFPSSLFSLTADDGVEERLFDGVFRADFFIPETSNISSDGTLPRDSCFSRQVRMLSTHILYSAGPQACSIYGLLLGLIISKQKRRPFSFCLLFFSATSRTVHSTMSQTLTRSRTPAFGPLWPVVRFPFSVNTPPLR